MHHEYGPGLYVPSKHPETGKSFDLELVAQTLAEIGIPRSVLEPVYDTPPEGGAPEGITLLRYNFDSENSLGYVSYAQTEKYFEEQGYSSKLNTRLWNGISRVNFAIVNDRAKQKELLPTYQAHALQFRNFPGEDRTALGIWRQVNFELWRSVTMRQGHLPDKYGVHNKQKRENWDIVEWPLLYERIRNSDGGTRHKPLDRELSKCKNLDRSDLFVDVDALYALLSESKLIGTKTDDAVKDFLNARIARLRQGNATSTN